MILFLVWPKINLSAFELLLNIEVSILSIFEPFKTKSINLINKNKMAFELPKLPYEYAALEPHIDARTWKSTTANITTHTLLT
jgi:hypothetical protein